MYMGRYKYVFTSKKLSFISLPIRINETRYPGRPFIVYGRRRACRLRAGLRQDLRELRGRLPAFRFGEGSAKLPPHATAKGSSATPPNRHSARISLEVLTRDASSCYLGT